MTSTDASPAPVPLFLLGAESLLNSERGTVCPGDLPPASDPHLVDRAKAARHALGNRAIVLGHHYQRDEVIQFADVVGDSYKLAQAAAGQHDAEYVIFCGVHFMAESADILTAEHQRVILPDLAAGCSMADMAQLPQVEDCWDALADLGLADTLVPITYMNSSADIKAFVGRHDGTVCTSSNARVSMEWGFERGERLLFFPDQHLGRNTAVRELGLSLDACVLWNPHRPLGGLTEAALRAAKVILWQGHCSVHGRFTLDTVLEARARIPGVTILVHPECRYEVVEAADLVGSTEFILKAVREAPAGSTFAIGTELNLVNRLAQEHPDKTVVFLDKTVCFCATMNRIDLPHLVWAMESLADGRVVNEIVVDPETKKYAKQALDRMLALVQAPITGD